MAACREASPPPVIAGTHLSLPPIDCSGPAPALTPVPLAGAPLDAPVRTVLPVLGGPPRAAFVGYAGSYVIDLSTRVPVAPRRLARIGEAQGQVGSLDAVRADSAGRFTVLDMSNVRITQFDSSGRVRAQVPVFPDVAVDWYGLDALGPIALETEPVPRGYAPTTGVITRRSASGSFVPTKITFRTPARHMTGEGAGIWLPQRPLERDPIIVAMPAGGLVINSTDTLELTWVDAAGVARVVRGNGVRIPITAAQRDSAARAYGMMMLPSDPGRPEAHARATLFVGRADHQLVDAILLLDSAEVAVRRTRACPDRQLWNRVRRDGTLGASFTLPLQGDALVARGDTVFVGVLDEGSLTLGWRAIGSAPPSVR